MHFFVFGKLLGRRRAVRRCVCALSVPLDLVTSGPVYSCAYSADIPCVYTACTPRESARGGGDVKGCRSRVCTCKKSQQVASRKTKKTSQEEKVSERSESDRADELSQPISASIGLPAVFPPKISWREVFFPDSPRNTPRPRTGAGRGASCPDAVTPLIFAP